MAIGNDQPRATDVERTRGGPHLQSPVDLTTPLQVGKKRSRQSLSPDAHLHGQAKKVHGKPQEALSREDYIAPRTLWELVEAHDGGDCSQLCFRVLEKAGKGLSPMRFLDCPEHVDVDGGKMRQVVAKLHMIVSDLGDPYQEPVRELVTALNMEENELRKLVEKRPRMTDEKPKTPRLPADLRKMYEDATPLMHSVFESQQKHEGLDATNDTINGRWGTGFAIQYNNFIEYCASATQLAAKFRHNPTEFDERDLRHLNHSVRRFVEDHEYPILWQIQFEIREHGLMQSTPSLKTPDELIYTDWKCCLSMNVPRIYSPHGDAVLTYREVTRKCRNNRYFKVINFIVRPCSNTPICTIQSGSEIGRDFVRTFNELPHKPTPFGDVREEDLPELAKFYRGIRLVACSWKGDNHVQAELEFVKRDEHGVSEYWAKWMSRGKTQRMLGPIKADREISRILINENNIPPWTKAKDAKPHQTRETRKLRQPRQPSQPSQLSQLSQLFQLPQLPHPSQPAQSHPECRSLSDLDKQLSKLSSEVRRQNDSICRLFQHLNLDQHQPGASRAKYRNQTSDETKPDGQNLRPSD